MNRRRRCRTQAQKSGDRRPELHRSFQKVLVLAEDHAGLSWRRRKAWLWRKVLGGVV